MTYSQAQPLYEECLSLQKDVFVEIDLRTLATMNQLARTLDISIGSGTQTIKWLAAVVLLYHSMNDTQKALQMYRTCVKLCRQLPNDTLVYFNNLAMPSYQQ